MGEHGDWGRRHVLDTPMLARVDALPVQAALDLGCGEGRFCRMLRARGIATIGIDPTAALIARARELDPGGDYRVERGEQLSAPAASMDLVVAYLALIDVPDLRACVSEVRRVLRHGGRFLIANLQAFNTAAIPQGWTHEPDGSRRFCIDHYLQERPVPVAWRGISISNWHRPLSMYMQALLEAGFELRHFDEPVPSAPPSPKLERYLRVPNFLVMEWRLPDR